MIRRAPDSEIDRTFATTRASRSCGRSAEGAPRSCAPSRPPSTCGPPAGERSLPRTISPLGGPRQRRVANEEPVNVGSPPHQGTTTTSTTGGQYLPVRRGLAVPDEVVAQLLRRALAIPPTALVHECIEVGAPPKLTPEVARREPTIADPTADRTLCNPGDPGGVGGRQELAGLDLLSERATPLADKIRDQVARAMLEIVHVAATPAAQASTSMNPLEGAPSTSHAMPGFIVSVVPEPRWPPW